MGDLGVKNAWFTDKSAKPNILSFEKKAKSINFAPRIRKTSIVAPRVQCRIDN